MSKRVVLAGLFSIQDEASTENKFQQKLEEAWPIISGVKNYSTIERELVDTDGVVSLVPAGPLKGCMLWVSGNGSVTFRHDSNTNGVNGVTFIVNGTISSITVQTTATSPVIVYGYLIED